MHHISSNSCNTTGITNPFPSITSGHLHFDKIPYQTNKNPIYFILVSQDRGASEGNEQPTIQKSFKSKIVKNTKLELQTFNKLLRNWR